MRHRLFTIASVVSLLLCVGAMTFWARSYWVTNTLMRQQTFTNLLLIHHSMAFNSHGGLCVWDLRRYDDGSGSHFDELPPGTNTTTWKLSSESVDSSYPYINASSLPGLPNETARSLEFHVIGFGFVRRIQHHDEIWRRDVVVIVPWVAVVLLTAFLPVIRLLRWRKSRLVAANAAMFPCRKCGYSLVKNTSGTCPECGTMVTGKRGVTA